MKILRRRELSTIFLGLALSGMVLWGGPITAVAFTSYPSTSVPHPLDTPDERGVIYYQEMHFSPFASVVVSDPIRGSGDHASARVDDWMISITTGALRSNSSMTSTAAQAIFSDRLLITGEANTIGTLSLLFDVRAVVNPHSDFGTQAYFCAFDQCSGYWKPWNTPTSPWPLPGPVRFLDSPIYPIDAHTYPQLLLFQRSFQTSQVFNLTYLGGGYSIATHISGSASLRASLVGLRIDSSSCPGCEFRIESESGLDYNALTAVPEPGFALGMALLLGVAMLVRSRQGRRQIVGERRSARHGVLQSG